MSSTPDRTAGLRAARARDSADKRRRARAAIQTLETAGTPITVSAVATAAGVSTWLLYTAGLREHLDAARRRQAQPINSTARATTPGDHAPVTPAGLRTDLALARDQVRQLRTERELFCTGFACDLEQRSTGPTRPT